MGEITLLKRIGFAKHPHVVSLFGCVTIPEPMCILLEYLEYGNLRDYLQSISEEVCILYMYINVLQPFMIDVIVYD